MGSKILGAMPPSRPQVLDATKVDKSGMVDGARDKKDFIALRDSDANLKS